MKTCPVCHAGAFDDAEVCYGCLYRYGKGPEGQQAVGKASPSPVRPGPQGAAAAIGHRPPQASCDGMARGAANAPVVAGGASAGTAAAGGEELRGSAAGSAGGMVGMRPVAGFQPARSQEAAARRDACTPVGSQKGEEAAMPGGEAVARGVGEPIADDRKAARSGGVEGQAVVHAASGPTELVLRFEFPGLAPAVEVAPGCGERAERAAAEPVPIEGGCAFLRKGLAPKAAHAEEFVLRVDRSGDRSVREQRRRALTRGNHARTPAGAPRPGSTTAQPVPLAAEA